MPSVTGSGGAAVRSSPSGRTPGPAHTSPWASRTEYPTSPRHASGPSAAGSTGPTAACTTPDGSSTRTPRPASAAAAGAGRSPGTLQTRTRSGSPVARIQWSTSARSTTPPGAPRCTTGCSSRSSRPPRRPITVRESRSDSVIRADDDGSGRSPVGRSVAARLSMTTRSPSSPRAARTAAAVRPARSAPVPARPPERHRLPCPSPTTSMCRYRPCARAAGSLRRISAAMWSNAARASPVIVRLRAANSMPDGTGPAGSANPVSVTPWCVVPGGTSGPPAGMAEGSATVAIGDTGSGVAGSEPSAGWAGADHRAPAGSGGPGSSVSGIGSSVSSQRVRSGPVPGPGSGRSDCRRTSRAGPSASSSRRTVSSTVSSRTPSSSVRRACSPIRRRSAAVRRSRSSMRSASRRSACACSISSIRSASWSSAAAARWPRRAAACSRIAACTRATSAAVPGSGVTGRGSSLCAIGSGTSCPGREVSSPGSVSGVLSGGRTGWGGFEVCRNGPGPVDGPPPPSGGPSAGPAG